MRLKSFGSLGLGLALVLAGRVGLADGTEYLSLPQNTESFSDFPARGALSVAATGGALYVGTSQGLAISQDSGKTFKTRTTAQGLPGNAIKYLLVSGSNLWAYTDNGNAISKDGGNTFTPKVGYGLGSNSVNAGLRTRA